ncbi:hypothetical protein DN540_33700 [Burkholderia multivorans]|nr:hypothetical protein DN540_33700 [Burkholderia multivorans]
MVRNTIERRGGRGGSNRGLVAASSQPGGVPPGVPPRAGDSPLKTPGGSVFTTAQDPPRLSRDATAGLFHPPSADAARPMYAAALLDD